DVAGAAVGFTGAVVGEVRDAEAAALAAGAARTAVTVGTAGAAGAAVTALTADAVEVPRRVVVGVTAGSRVGRTGDVAGVAAAVGVRVAPDDSAGIPAVATVAAAAA